MTLEEFMELRYRTVLVPIAPQDGGGWLVESPDLPGCASDGETREEALANFEDARREWFLAVTEKGGTIPLPQAEEVCFSGKFTLRLPRTLHRELARAAQREGVSLNQYVLSILSYGFGVKTSSTACRFSFERSFRIDCVYPDNEAPAPLNKIALWDWRTVNDRSKSDT